MEKGRAEPCAPRVLQSEVAAGDVLLLEPVVLPWVSPSFSAEHLPEAVRNGTVENAFSAAPQTLPGVSTKPVSGTLTHSPKLFLNPVRILCSL